MSKKNAAQLPGWLTSADLLRLYTPDEVIEMKMLPYTKRSLLASCYAKRIPHTKVAGKIMFRLDHIFATQQAGDVNPATRGRRRAA